MTDSVVRHPILSRGAITPWLRGALLGAILGTLFLGFGGRAAMRAIAVAQGTAPGISFGGTMTVVFLGILSGIAAGLIYAACRQLLRQRVWWARGIFAAVVLGITLRGLRPLDAQRLIIFLPLFVAFGFTLDRLWDRSFRS